MTKTNLNSYGEIEESTSDLRKSLYDNVREAYIQAKDRLNVQLEDVFEKIQREGDLEKLVCFVEKIKGSLENYQLSPQESKEFSYSDFETLKEKGMEYAEIKEIAKKYPGFNETAIRKYSIDYGKAHSQKSKLSEEQKDRLEEITQLVKDKKYGSKNYIFDINYDKIPKEIIENIFEKHGRAETFPKLLRIVEKELNEKKDSTIKNGGGRTLYIDKSGVVYTEKPQTKK